MSWRTTRPDPSEYAESYTTYVAHVPDGDIVERLDSQIEETLALLRPIGEEKAGHRYGPGKWSVREVMGHVADAERVFAYRGLRFARNDATPLAGFEQDDYVGQARFEDRPLRDVLDEWEAMRRANVILFGSFDDEVAARTGVANGFTFTARSIAWILAGHELHHRKLLEERYL